MDSAECRQFRSGQLQADDVRGGRNLLRVSRRRNGTSAKLQTGFFTSILYVNCLRLFQVLQKFSINYLLNNSMIGVKLMITRFLNAWPPFENGSSVST